jgi:hypothetical protein
MDFTMLIQKLTLPVVGRPLLDPERPTGGAKHKQWLFLQRPHGDMLLSSANI